MNKKTQSMPRNRNGPERGLNLSVKTIYDRYAYGRGAGVRRGRGVGWVS